MLVELGNDNPRSNAQGAAVCYMNVDDTYTYEVQDSAADAAGIFRTHIGDAATRDGVTQLPGQEALLSVAAAWRAEGNGDPAWVWSDNADFATLLGAFFNCPVGRPGDVEDRYHTVAGPPGVAPPVAVEAPVEEVPGEPTPA